MNNKMNKSMLLLFCFVSLSMCYHPELHYKHLNKSEIVGNESKGNYEIREYE